MKLTEKENLLLKDLKTAEQLCIDKYGEYAKIANDKKLKNLFNSILEKENEHLKTVQKILSGKAVTMPSGKNSSSSQKSGGSLKSQAKLSQKEIEKDCFLCQDLLSTEKYVASVYNTGVFEFTQPKLRNILNHIQKEEQEHGFKIYQYLSANNMVG